MAKAPTARPDIEEMQHRLRRIAPDYDWNQEHAAAWFSQHHRPNNFDFEAPAEGMIDVELERRNPAST